MSQTTEEEVVATHAQNMAYHPHHHPMSPELGIPNGYSMQHNVSASFNNGPMHAYAHPMQEFTDNMPQHSLPQNYIPNVHPQFQDLNRIQNQSPVSEDLTATDKAGKPKKGAATSAANDKELRRLLRENQGESLQKTAARIHRAEGAGEKSEKHKQVFAMLWLQQNCRRSSSSVRRDSVFSRYGKRCGSERVPALNPASFGKLVRILFPNVQTRRLGIRGESKYHYCELALIPTGDDDDEEEGSQITNANGRRVDTPNSENANNSTTPILQHQKSASMSQVPQAPTDTADFPSPKHRNPQPLLVKSPSLAAVSPPLTPTVRTDCQGIPEPTFTLDLKNISADTRLSLKTALPLDSQGQPYLTTKLNFNQSAWESDKHLEDLGLPNIHRFLAQRSVSYDYVTASSLGSVYRSHCLNLVDSFRRRRDKAFWKHHHTLLGTMTVPVQKLFFSPVLIPWIEECDTRAYQKMIELIRQLTIQDVPKEIIDFFSEVGDGLIGQVNDSCIKMPPHVLATKIVPASRFVHLIKQWVRVNMTARLAASILSSHEVRTEMWFALLQYCNPKSLLEQGQFTPDSQTAAENILRYHIKALLGPINPKWMDSAERKNPVWTPFLNQSSSNDDYHSFSPIQEDIGEYIHPSVFLERCIQYLHDLAKRFPGHTAHCILNHQLMFWKSIVTEIGLNHGPAFHSWWALETFISTMLRWQLEVGGYLDQTSTPQVIPNSTVEPPVHVQGEQMNGKGNGGVALKPSTPTMPNHPSVDVNETDEERPTSRPATAESVTYHPNLNRMPDQPHTDSVAADTAHATLTPAPDRTGDKYNLPAFDAEDMGVHISPVKNFKYPSSMRKSSIMKNPNSTIDDSGIGLQFDSDPIGAAEPWAYVNSDPMEKETEAKEQEVVSH